MRLAILVLLLCSGCTYQAGRHFDETWVDHIRKGVTTEAQIRKWFGEPLSIQPASSDGVVLQYGHMKTGRVHEGSMITGYPVRTKELKVLVQRGVVTNYTYTDKTCKGRRWNTSC